MKVDVLLFAQLKEAAGTDHLFLEIWEGTPVKELVEHLMEEPRFLRCKDLPFIYAVNENFVSQDRILHEADTLALMTPVSGGAM